MHYRLIIPVYFAAMILTTLQSSAAEPDANSAVARMSQPGPEEKQLKDTVGVWDVVFILRTSADAQPVETRELVAERTMVGSILQEILHPASGSKAPDFRRIDYLNFDRVEGRWKYVSMDTRFPVSIMPAWSRGPARDGKITLEFEPQAFVGFGQAVEGRYMVSEMVVSRPDANHETKQQHVLMADGASSGGWILAEYQYTRRQ
jgi:hypothetical protein